MSGPLTEDPRFEDRRPESAYAVVSRSDVGLVIDVRTDPHDPHTAVRTYLALEPSIDAAVTELRKAGWRVASPWRPAAAGLTARIESEP